jgi:hypothetical protein
VRRLWYAGFELRIETEAGEARSPGHDPEHPRAQHLVPYAYGFFVGTNGKDGEEIDVHLGSHPDATMAYVIDCNVPGDREDKVMLGFASSEEALRAFSAAYQGGGAEFIEGVREMSHAELRKFLRIQKEAAVPLKKVTSSYVSFTVVCKEVRKDAGGTPILRMLVSGTKLDSQGYEYQGVKVLGEKVQAELLASMAEQAQAGGVYLLENHSSTLRLGISRGAEIIKTADGNLELYVSFELFVDNPLVPFLLKDQERGYVPDCSVGMFVKREIVWDQEENGYVGKLLEGLFEHVALTRPDHAAYPDAEIEEVFLEESLASALKSLFTVPRAAERREGGSMATNRVAGGAGTRTMKEAAAATPKPNPETEESALLERNKEAEAKKEAEAECKTKEAEAEDKKEAEGEAEGGKEAEAEGKKEAEDAKDAEAGGLPPEPPANLPGKTPPPEPEKEADAEAGGQFTLKDAIQHARDMAALMKDSLGEGANPQDAVDLLTDIQEDFEQLCAMLEGLGGAPPPAAGAVAAEDEAEADADAEAGADAGAAAPPPAEPPPPAKKPAPAAAPGADGGGGGAVHIHGKPAGDVHIHGKEATKPAPPPRKGVAERLAEKRELRKVEKETNLMTRLDRIEKLLQHLDSEPATPGPRKFNDAFAGVFKSGEPEAETGSDTIQKLLEGISNPAERDRLSRLGMEALITRIHGGGQGSQ